MLLTLYDIAALGALYPGQDLRLILGRELETLAVFAADQHSDRFSLGEGISSDDNLAFDYFAYGNDRVLSILRIMTRHQPGLSGLPWSSAQKRYVNEESKGGR